MAGILLPTGGIRNAALWRLTSSGRPDLGFGASGLVLTTFNDMPTDYDGVVVDGSNRLVVVGYRNGSGELPAQLTLARYSESGALDETFGAGGDGKVLVPSPLTCFGNSVAVLADGSILAGGWTAVSVNDSSTGWHIAAWRFSAGGVLDVTFGENGTFSDPITGNAHAVQHGMALDSDGGIIIGGRVTVHGSTYVPYGVIVRLWQ
jgi:uncharacterized delta-60 repeat protein